MFLLDTNVVSELRRRDRADPKVAAWIKPISPAELYLSAITILEIETGVLLMERRDASQGDVLRTWLESRVMPVFEGRIISIDTAVARRCARLHVPDPRSERDALIAATALVHRLKVVTRNIMDFQAMGVDLVNPWQ